MSFVAEISSCGKLPTEICHSEDESDDAGHGKDLKPTPETDVESDTDDPSDSDESDDDAKVFPHLKKTTYLSTVKAMNTFGERAAFIKCGNVFQ